MNQNSNPIRVIKLGGSLLDWEALSQVFMNWIDLQNRVSSNGKTILNVVLCGGGNFANQVRELNVSHHFSESAAHRWCIQLMNITAEMLHELLPDADLTDNLSIITDQLDRTTTKSLFIFKIERLLQDHLGALPENWSVTSDSLSAWLAQKLQATELVLLKSTLSDFAKQNGASAETNDPAAWAASQLVDEYFPSFYPTAFVTRIVNLRSERLEEISYHCN